MLNVKTAAGWMVALAVGVAPAGAQTPGVPYRYIDFSTSQQTTTPRIWQDLGLFASLGDRVVFVADTTGELGRELWITDGTAGGTRLLKDLDPRVGHDLALSQVRTFAGPGGRSAVFVGADETGEQVVVTDGTAAGTRVIPAGVGVSQLLGVAGGRVVMQKGTNVVAVDPDGVRTLAGPLQAPTFASTAVEVGGLLYYWVGSTSIRQWDLWVTDGTSEGTRAVDGFATDTSNAAPTIAVAGARLFTWRSDGTTATPVVIDAATGVAQEFDLNGSAPDGTAVVLPLPDGSGAVYGTAVGLVRTDGTVAGTQVIGAGVAAPTLGNQDPDPLPKVIQSPAGPVTVFAGRTAAAGIELWATDGTEAGTRILLDATPGTGSTSPTSLGAAPGRYYALTNQGVLMTDGTPAGTANLGAGTLWAASFSSIQGPFTATLGDGVLVRPRATLAQDLGLVRRYQGPSWASLETGPAARTVWSQSAQPAVAVGDAAVVAVGDASVQARLWRTEGSFATTTPLTPVMGGISELSAIGGLAWFMVRDTATQSTLWRSDGTDEGTFDNGSFTHANPPTFYDLVAGVDGVTFGSGRQYTASGARGSLREVGRTPGFSAPDGAGLLYECSLRSSDQTISVTDPATGTVTQLMVVRNNNWMGAVFQPLAGRMYFAAYDGRRKLYRSDGTVAGTQMLSQDLQNEQIGAAGGRIIYVDTDGSSQRLMALTPDGTMTVLAGGLRLVDDLRNFGDRVIMLVDDLEHGLEPWITDGTPGGTRMIAETAPGRRGAVGTSYKCAGWGGRFYGRGYKTKLLYPAGGRCYFSVATDTRAAHAWVTDGTAEGTHPLAREGDDPRQAPVGASWFAEKGGAVLFRGWTPDLAYQYYAVRTCEADFTTDGFLDFFDYLGFIDAFEAGTPDADFNGDGFLDFFDYDAFVGAFERGC